MLLDHGHDPAGTVPRLRLIREAVIQIDGLLRLAPYRAATPALQRQAPYLMLPVR